MKEFFFLFLPFVFVWFFCYSVDCEFFCVFLWRTRELKRRNVCDWKCVKDNENFWIFYACSDHKLKIGKTTKSKKKSERELNTFFAHHDGFFLYDFLHLIFRFVWKSLRWRFYLDDNKLEKCCFRNANLMVKIKMNS